MSAESAVEPVVPESPTPAWATWKSSREASYRAAREADESFALPTSLDRAPWDMDASEFAVESARFRGLSEDDQLRELAKLYFVEERFRPSERNTFRPVVLVAVTATLALLALTFVPALADAISPWIPSVSSASEKATSTASSFDERLVELQPKFGQLSATETRVLNEEAGDAIAANQALVRATNYRPFLDVVVMILSAVAAIGIFALWRHGRRRARFADYSRARAGALIRLYEAIRTGAPKGTSSSS